MNYYKAKDCWYTEDPQPGDMYNSSGLFCVSNIPDNSKGVVFEIYITPLQSETFSPSNSSGCHQEHHASVIIVEFVQGVKEHTRLFL